MDFDYYKELDIARDASSDEIRKAYRKLAMKYHPDRTKGDKEKEEKFKRINVAHEVLSDDSKRQEYDTYGTIGGQRSGSYSQDFNVDLGDLFNQFFNGGSSRRHQMYDPNAPMKGNDVELTIKVNLEQVVAGANVKFDYVADDACDKCQGAGVDTSKQSSTCNRCNGMGVVQAGNSFLSINQTCGACRGTGVNQPYCTLCGGKRVKKATRNIDFKLPTGLDENQYVRLRNKGHGGLNDGPNGDLYLKLQIKKHHFFERQGLNLHCVMPVNLTDCLLGRSLEIPTIGGKSTTLKIPECSQPNAVLKIANQGLKRDGRQGHIFVNLDLKLPSKLSAKEKAHILELQKILEISNQQSNNSSWLDSLKKYANKVTDYLEDKISS